MSEIGGAHSSTAIQHMPDFPLPPCQRQAFPACTPMCTPKWTFRVVHTQCRSAILSFPAYPHFPKCIPHMSEFRTPTFPHSESRSARESPTLTSQMQKLHGIREMHFESSYRRLPYPPRGTLTYPVSVRGPAVGSCRCLPLHGDTPMLQASLPPTRVVGRSDPYAHHHPSPSTPCTRPHRGRTLQPMHRTPEVGTTLRIYAPRGGHVHRTHADKLVKSEQVHRTRA